MNSIRWSVRIGASAVVFALVAGALAHAQGDGHASLQNEPAVGDTARPLFIANCATCHGENGDGQGATKLEKPARSFKDGGFSYGNTPEAILRTITNGIPGTPMPSFASALKEAERKELARYVLALGPPETKVSQADTILVVRDRALFVRGKLPSIAEGAPERPRGLFVGTPDGFTFEYRVDDVRLLGVRQGGFVERADWQGRGGDAQKPLGKLVYLFGGGNPGPTFGLRAADKTDITPLSARFSATLAVDGGARIAYVLFAETQPLRTRLAWVEESPRAQASAIGSGFARTFDVEDLGSGGRYALCVSSTKGAQRVDAAESILSSDKAAKTTAEEERDRQSISENGGRAPTKSPPKAAAPRQAPLASKQSWIARSRPDGTFEIQLVRGLQDGETFATSGDELWIEFGADAGGKRTIEVVTLLAPVWDAEVRAKWTKELE